MKSDNYVNRIREKKKKIIDPILLSGMGSRISEISGVVGSKKKLAKVAGISEAQLYRIIKGENQPTIGPLVAMAKAANVSLEWLAIGVGAGESGIHGLTIADEVNDSSAEYNLSEFALIPQYEVEASAGSGQLIDQEPEIGKMAFRHDWLKTKGYRLNALATIRIKGDSMVPTLSDGAMVLVDMQQTDILGEGIYIIQNDGHLFAKRLQTDFNNGLYIKSDNPAYSEQHLKQEEAKQLRIVGKVVWSGNEL